MKLTDAFDRVVVLNLPFKTDRRERLSSHLVEAGLVDPDKVVWQRATCGDWTGHPAWWSAGNGAWGCLMSHVRACEDAISDGLANYLVLEDDVVFHPRASEMLERLMTHLPTDWGQLYLGGQYLHREPEIVPDTDGQVMRPFNVNRTHAFALNKAAMAPFLRHVLHAPDYMGYEVGSDGFPKLCGNHFHIDHQLGRAHERMDWPVYSPRWWLAGQEAGDSNVSGKVNPRLWWNWRDWGHRLPFVILPFDAPAEDVASAKTRYHFGNNLIASTARDQGLDRALRAGDVSGFLHTIAGEAIERWLLPAVQIKPDKLPLIESHWQPGTVTNDAAHLVADYPFGSATDFWL
jgi:hypothetical protein